MLERRQLHSVVSECNVLNSKAAVGRLFTEILF
jgi:hypothetical protein